MSTGARAAGMGREVEDGFGEGERSGGKSVVVVRDLVLYIRVAIKRSEVLPGEGWQLEWDRV